MINIFIDKKECILSPKQAEDLLKCIKSIDWSKIPKFTIHDIKTRFDHEALELRLLSKLKNMNDNTKVGGDVGKAI